jgi:RNA polymerase sigma-70 factor, ECF subfamily
MLAGILDKGHIRQKKEEVIWHGPMTELQQDIALVQRIAAKDETALQELYATYGQRLYVYALRLTEDPAQAEDVVQDVLVIVWRSAQKFRGESRLLAWLLGIVHHIAMKSLRRRVIPITDEMEASLIATSPLPEEQALAGERSEWVREGLQRLSPKHRAVLELVFYQGMSLQETAQVCGCPIGTVKSRLSYARQQLRGVLSRTEEVR